MCITAAEHDDLVILLQTVTYKTTVSVMSVSAIPSCDLSSAL